MSEQPSYYAIIPAEVRYDSNLSANEKLLYGEITCLTKSTGECWAGNKYFADLYQRRKETISLWVKHLSEQGYINTRLVYKEETKVVDRRIITLPDRIQVPPRDLSDHPPAINLKENSTSINITRTNKDIVACAPDKEAMNSKNGHKSSKELPSSTKEDLSAVFRHYNEVRCGMPECKKLTPIRVKQVKARIAEVGLDGLLDILTSCKDMPHLLGQNDRGWKADLEWLTKDSNFTKVIEGKYLRYTTPANPKAFPEATDLV